MTIAELNALVSSIEGAVACRTKTMGNFIAIPNGKGGYSAVKISALLAVKTENHQPFDVESAHAERMNFDALQIAKANLPKKEKAVNVEAQARRDALDAKVMEAVADWEDGKQYTATEVMNMMPNTFKTVMECGSTLLRVANSKVISVCKGEKGKNVYTKV